LDGPDKQRHGYEENQNIDRTIHHVGKHEELRVIESDTSAKLKTRVQAALPLSRLLTQRNSA
jgi:hypothetical protein